MTMFYQGTLQDGIALAVREAKAVVCFVRDDAQLSSTWEEEYFADHELAQVLAVKSVLLRLTAGSQEAGFLTSFCPIAKFPAVVVIQNGALQDYFDPQVSKDDFKRRLLASVGNQQYSAPTPPQQQQAATSNESTASSSSLAATSLTPDTTSQRQSPQAPTVSPSPVQRRPQESSESKASDAEKEPTKKAVPTKGQLSKSEPKQKPTDKAGKQSKTPHVPRETTGTTADKATTRTSDDPKPQPSAPRGPPSQYRLQVRLFDGRSIRSSFSPTQTIRGDVRPWLDQEMVDDHRPYNLKHILTPLPSQTLSVSEESQALQDLSLGSTANLVMVPVQSYTEAYSAAGSLPARAISGVYNVVSSVAGTATGLVGSFLGYTPSTPVNEPAPASSPSTDNARRPRPSGPNIRTLRDQQNDRGNSQLYNGNQLNFEPRDQDGKDK